MKLIALIFFCCAILLCENKPLSDEETGCIVLYLLEVVNVTGKIEPDAVILTDLKCDNIVDIQKEEIYEAIRGEMKNANVTNEADCVIKSLEEKYFADYTLLYYIERKHNKDKKRRRTLLNETKARLDSISENSLKECNL